MGCRGEVFPAHVFDASQMACPLRTAELRPGMWFPSACSEPRLRWGLLPTHRERKLGWGWEWGRQGQRSLL